MTTRRHSRRAGVALWCVAVLLMLTAGVYQRLTGPTYPLRGEITVEDRSYSYRLRRSQENSFRLS